MTKSKQKIIILGTNDYAHVVAEIVAETPGLQMEGFIENLDRSKCDKTLSGLPVYWIDDAAPLAADCFAVCCLATVNRSRFIQQARKLGFRFATVIHPTARVPASAVISEGCILEPGAILSTNTQLGAHVRINRGATIGHDTSLGDYCTVQPGVNIAGKCCLGSGVYVGIGATVVDNLTIGNLTVIGAGAVVINDLPDKVLAVGVPAKIIKENIEGK
jgi:sugar O-acyltransferase (sialic acid O-acetyltransferase NeuD family)